MFGEDNTTRAYHLCYQPLWGCLGPSSSSMTNPPHGPMRKKRNDNKKHQPKPQKPPPKKKPKNFGSAGKAEPLLASLSYHKPPKTNQRKQVNPEVQEDETRPPKRKGRSHLSLNISKYHKQKIRQPNQPWKNNKPKTTKTHHATLQCKVGGSE